MSSPLTYFFRGDKNVFEDAKFTAEPEKRDEKAKDYIKSKISELLDIKNLSVLVGAGCSSLVKDDAAGIPSEVGIPTMVGLAEEFCKSNLTTITETLAFLSESTLSEVKGNLERLLELLYAQRFLLERSKDSVDALKAVNALIRKTVNFILEKCQTAEQAGSVLDIYKVFFRKLLYRSSSLPRVNIFTTNYDLFPEIALDELGVLFCNGFTGTVKRYFNPSIFNYALAERMDISGNRWGVIDNYLYLYKLHGSINWIEEQESGKLFNVREVQKVEKVEETQAEASSPTNVMIYPTPTKQNSSFGSPYSDLFREFQKKLMQNDNVLITVGYNFGDEHINNLIYQALTVPTFRLVIFNGNHQSGELKKLKALNDSRIWIIGGKLGTKKIHYFESVAQDLFPDLPERRIDASLENVMDKLINQKRSKSFVTDSETS